MIARHLDNLAMIRYERSGTAHAVDHAMCELAGLLSAALGDGGLLLHERVQALMAAKDAISAVRRGFGIAPESRESADLNCILDSFERAQDELAGEPGVV